MKRLIKHYVIDTYTLYLVSLIASGLTFQDGVRTLLMAGLGLTAVTIFAKPIINLMLLPLNMVTYGLFRWVSSAVALYIVELIIKEFKIVEFTFTGFSNKWIDIPAMHFEGVAAYVAFAFMLSLFTSIIHWVFK